MNHIYTQCHKHCSVISVGYIISIIICWYLYHILQYYVSDSAYRIPNPKLPTIPVHPIGYDDAKQLLQYVLLQFIIYNA